MDRKTYWNETYVKYWKEVTSEANDKTCSESHVKKLYSGDSKVAGNDAVYRTLDLLNFKPGDKVLDYGCGFGRLVRYFYKKKNEFYGIDISEEMIKECKISFPDYSDKFFVAEGESLPFENNFFDKIVCYGVFDACYQELALQEMFRVSQVNGKILLTGKNSCYFDDDKQALIAEEAARKKGHPNYFTDVKKMMEVINVAGGIIEKERYFLYRGDVGKEKFVEKMPEKFYEWQIVIKKEFDMTMMVFPKFSDVYSKTWGLRS